MCWMPIVRWSIGVMAAGHLLLLVACGADPTPTTAPEPQATPAPTEMPTLVPTLVPTPTRSAEEELSDLLSSVEDKLAAMSTATFNMVDETESGAPFFGTTFKSLTGQVRSPDSFWMLVKVVAPGFGFVEIEMTAVGEEAYMKFSEDAPWTPLPVEQVPFNFGEIGLSLSRLVPAVSNVSLAGLESVEDTQTIRFEGTIDSEGMSGLITGVDPGHTITLTFWVHEVDHTLRQFRIGGQLFNNDAPETTRLLDITGVNVEVDIQLPDPATQQ